MTHKSRHTQRVLLRLGLTTAELKLSNVMGPVKSAAARPPHILDQSTDPVPKYPRWLSPTWKYLHSNRDALLVPLRLDKFCKGSADELAQVQRPQNLCRGPKICASSFFKSSRVYICVFVELRLHVRILGHHLTVMNLLQAFATEADSFFKIVLLDIHMVRIKMDANIRCTNGIH